MITLITGTPGAGKTLYAISKLLLELVGSVVKSTDENGNEIEIKRRILTNINRLIIDHELIGPDEGGGLADWHLWCKPGDVIVYDEVQRSWPPRPNGAKVPDYISALETHRHKGVDFIILTQHPMLLDRNVLALVGRHLHVRRLGGMGAAMVYEWDHCSRSLLYSKALKKHAFKYDKKVFKLYLSSELHTKQGGAIPPLVYVVIIALLAAVFFIPYTMKRIGEKNNPPPAAAPGQKPGEIQPGQQGAVPGQQITRSSNGSNQVAPGATGDPHQGQRYDSTIFTPVVSYEPRSAPAYDHLRQIVAMPRVIGGICFGQECQCWAQQAVRVLSSGECGQWMHNPRFDPYRPDRPAPDYTALAGPSPAAAAPLSTE